MTLDRQGYFGTLYKEILVILSTRTKFVRFFISELEKQIRVRGEKINVINQLLEIRLLVLILFQKFNLLYNYSRYTNSVTYSTFFITIPAPHKSTCSYHNLTSCESNFVGFCLFSSLFTCFFTIVHLTLFPVLEIARLATLFETSVHRLYLGSLNVLGCLFLSSFGNASSFMQLYLTIKTVAEYGVNVQWSSQHFRIQVPFIYQKQDFNLSSHHLSQN